MRRAPPPNPLTPDSRHLFPVPPFLIHSHGHIGYLDPIGIGQVGRHARNLAVLRNSDPDVPSRSLPPHFHAVYAGADAIVGIRPVAVLVGRLSPRVTALIVEWATLE